MIENLRTLLDCERTIKLAGLAYRLATEQLDADDAQYLIFMMEPIAGWYSIATICVEDVMDDLKDKYNNPPDQLLRYAEQASARVGRKWDDSGETVGPAREWALDLVREYAKEDGITLIDRDKIDDE